MTRSKNCRKSSSRRGAATVEFAVCLPMLLVLVFGTIESASRIFLKQTLAVSAYETAREAIRAGSTKDKATTQGKSILSARKVVDGDVKITPNDVAGTARGTKVIVEVTAPTAKNSPMLGSFVANKNITARVVMLKE